MSYTARLAELGITLPKPAAPAAPAPAAAKPAPEVRAEMPAKGRESDMKKFTLALIALALVASCGPKKKPEPAPERGQWLGYGDIHA